MGGRPPSAPRAAGAAVTLGEGIFLVGGVPGGTVYRYDVPSDTWTTLPPPADQREHVAAVALDDEIWALAGRWKGEIFDTTEVYDPDTQTWRAGPSLGEPRSGFGAVVVDGAIVVAGGEVFSPTRRWLRWKSRARRWPWAASSHSPTGCMAIHSWRSTPPFTCPVARFGRRPSTTMA